MSFVPCNDSVICTMSQKETLLALFTAKKAPRFKNWPILGLGVKKKEDRMEHQPLSKRRKRNARIDATNKVSTSRPRLSIANPKSPKEREIQSVRTIRMMNATMLLEACDELYPHLAPNERASIRGITQYHTRGMAKYLHVAHLTNQQFRARLAISKSHRRWVTKLCASLQKAVRRFVLHQPSRQQVLMSPKRVAFWRMRLESAETAKVCHKRISLQFFQLVLRLGRMGILVHGPRWTTSNKLFSMLSCSMDMPLSITSNAVPVLHFAEHTRVKVRCVPTSATWATPLDVATTLTTGIPLRAQTVLTRPTFARAKGQSKKGYPQMQVPACTQMKVIVDLYHHLKHHTLDVLANHVFSFVDPFDWTVPLEPRSTPTRLDGIEHSNAASSATSSEDVAMEKLIDS